MHTLLLERKERKKASLHDVSLSQTAAVNVTPCLHTVAIFSTDPFPRVFWAFQKDVHIFLLFFASFHIMLCNIVRLFLITNSLRILHYCRNSQLLCFILALLLISFLKKNFLIPESHYAKVAVYLCVCVCVPVKRRSLASVSAREHFSIHSFRSSSSTAVFLSNAANCFCDSEPRSLSSKCFSWRYITYTHACARTCKHTHTDEHAPVVRFLRVCF